MAKKDMLAEVRENILSACADMDELLKFAEAWTHAGNVIFNQYVNGDTRDKFFQGCSMMRDALYAHQSEQIRRMFYIIGVADDKMLEYVRKNMIERFGKDMEIMSFMDKWGRVGSWYGKDEKELRKAALSAATTTVKTGG